MGNKNKKFNRSLTNYGKNTEPLIARHFFVGKTSIKSET